MNWDGVLLTFMLTSSATGVISIILKLCGVLSISWWLVVSPLIAMVVVPVIFVLVSAALVMILSGREEEDVC